MKHGLRADHSDVRGQCHGHPKSRSCAMDRRDYDTGQSVNRQHQAGVLLLQRKSLSRAEVGLISFRGAGKVHPRAESPARAFEDDGTHA